MSIHFRRRRLLRSLAFSCVCAAGLSGPALAADGDLDKVVDAGIDRVESNQAFQKKIDELDAVVREKFDEYRQVNKEIEGLQVYLTQLRTQIQSQQKEMTNLGDSIEKVTLIERQITPHMLKMIEGLDKFVALDMPFLAAERAERVQRLRDMISRSDVSTAEKFRNVMEAYLTEVEYGNTIEAYRGTLTQDGVDRDVDFLRIGRIAYLYQTLDGRQSGLWNVQQNSWQALSAAYNSQVRDGLKIARQQAAPDLIKLPLMTAQEIAQ